MVHICAWCERFLGADDPDVVISHGICEPCRERARWKGDPAVLVLSRRRSPLLSLFTELLRGTPSIRVLVDRRHIERRVEDVSRPQRSDRRLNGDRRGDPGMIVS